jgi:hypothetical protein
MEQKKLSEVQAELKEATLLRRTKESELEDLTSKFLIIQKAIESSLENLQIIKDKESSLQNKVFLIQKDAFKETISVSGLKKLFSNNNSFVKKIKEKGKEIKEVLDGTAFDKEWIDEQYEKYKSTCIKKGEEIKSKEEFKIIAGTIKEIKDGANNINWNSLLNKAENGFNKVKTKVQEVWTASNFEDEINIKFDPTSSLDISSVSHSDKIDPPETKKEGLELWITHSGVSYSEEKINQLYEEYTDYLNKNFGNDISSEKIYSFKGGAFKTALKKSLSL